MNRSPGLAPGALGLPTGLPPFVFALTGSALTVLVLTLAGLTLAAPAAADELVSSEPHAAETIDHAPEAIVLTFDEPLLLEPGANSAAIVGQDGRRIDDGKAAIANYSARSLVVRPDPGVELEGEVSVAYVVTFESGGSREGSFAFTVDAEFEGEREPAPAAVNGPASEEGVVIWTLVILTAIALFALLAYYMRFATDNAQSSLEGPAEDHGDEAH